MCTIMVGRLDDWLKVVADKQIVTVDPGYLEWEGVAVFKLRISHLPLSRGYLLATSRQPRLSRSCSALVPVESGPHRRPQSR